MNSTLTCFVAETQSAITLTSYKRDALLKLSQSPLAATCVPDSHRLARLASILTASASPTPEQLGSDIKSSHVDCYDAGSERLDTPSARSAYQAVTGMKPSSYNPIQFDREKYAAKYATLFTPDHSLMKPVDSQWTPSTMLPLVTPFGNNQLDTVSVANSKLSFMCPSGKEAKDKEMLRPSAKVFIPTGTPILNSNPQPQRGLCTSMHAGKAQHRDVIESFSDGQSLRRSMINSPAQSMADSAMFAPFEVPKALTPLAAPSASAGLPPRPIACAMAPNLPRWAHSPGHAMLASLDSKYKSKTHSMDSARPSMIRRASPPGSMHDGVSMSQKPQPVSSRISDDDSDHFESGMMSAVTRSTHSGSMTPWARRRTAIEVNVKGHESDMVEEMAAISIYCNASFASDQMPMSSSEKTPSSSVPVNAIREVKPVAPFDGNSWRRQMHSSWANQPRKPSLTPSVPGGLLGAVPMHSVSAK